MTGLDSEQLQSEDGESPVKVEVKQEQNEKVPDQDLPDDSGNDAVDENELEAKNEKSFIVSTTCTTSISMPLLCANNGH